MQSLNQKCLQVIVQTLFWKSWCENKTKQYIDFQISQITSFIL